MPLPDRNEEKASRLAMAYKFGNPFDNPQLAFYHRAALDFMERFEGQRIVPMFVRRNGLSLTDLSVYYQRPRRYIIKRHPHHRQT